MKNAHHKKERERFLKKLKEKLDISRAELSKILGISPSQCAYFMTSLDTLSGYRHPTLPQAYRIMELAKKHNIECTLEMIYPKEDFEYIHSRHPDKSSLNPNLKKFAK